MACGVAVWRPAIMRTVEYLYARRVLRRLMRQSQRIWQT